MEQQKLAVYWDFENLSKGLRPGPEGSGEAKPLLAVYALMEFLRPRGTIIVNRAYNHWESVSTYSSAMIEAGADLIQIYPLGIKNSADIRLAVDAMEDAYLMPEITQCVILSSDRDYIPLAHKLRKLSKRVIGIGMHGTAHEMWVKSCDEFLYYHEIAGTPPPPQLQKLAPSPIQPVAAVKALPVANGAPAKAAPTRGNGKATAAKPAAKAKATNQPAAKTQEQLEKERKKGAILFAATVQGLIKDSQASVDLQRIGIAIRGQDSAFSLRKYGHSASKGLKAMAVDAETRKIVTLQRNNGTIMVSSGSKLEEMARLFLKET
jgi:hypothetical protein